MSIGALPPVFSEGGGAVQRRVTELASAQAAAGHEVRVFSPGPTTHDIQRAGMHVCYLGCRSRGAAMHIEFLVRSRRAAKRYAKPDVIHVHNEPEGAAILASWTRPVVLSFDNFYFRQRWGSIVHSAYRRALLAFDLLLPVSEYCAKEAAAYWNLPRSGMRVLPNGVNTTQFAPQPEAAAAERARLGVDGDLLLYVGRISAQKGVDVLLDAFQLLRERAARDVTLVLAGPVEQFDDRDRNAQGVRWRNEIERVGAVYLGRVPEARLAALLNAADVFIMPTVELEMQGMAALEAQACGVPVVASDHGGLPETVPARCGARFETGNPSALAASVLSLLDDPESRTLASVNARSHAEAYGWTTIASRAIEAYDSVQVPPASDT